MRVSAANRTYEPSRADREFSSPDSLHPNSRRPARRRAFRFVGPVQKRNECYQKNVEPNQEQGSWPGRRAHDFHASIIFGPAVLALLGCDLQKPPSRHKLFVRARRSDATLATRNARRTGPLAQSAEHLTLNQGVVGSIPTRPTSDFCKPNLPAVFQILFVQFVLLFVIFFLSFVAAFVFLLQSF